jgi:hypothetical protein
MQGQNPDACKNVRGKTGWIWIYNVFRFSLGSKSGAWFGKTGLDLDQRARAPRVQRELATCPLL